MQFPTKNLLEWGTEIFEIFGHSRPGFPLLSDRLSQLRLTIRPKIPLPAQRSRRLLRQQLYLRTAITWAKYASSILKQCFGHVYKKNRKNRKIRHNRHRHYFVLATIFLMRAASHDWAPSAIFSSPSQPGWRSLGNENTAANSTPRRAGQAIGGADAGILKLRLGLRMTAPESRTRALRGKFRKSRKIVFGRMIYLDREGVSRPLQRRNDFRGFRPASPLAAAQRFPRALPPLTPDPSPPEYRGRGESRGATISE